MFSSPVIYSLLVVLVVSGASCEIKGPSGVDDSFKNHFDLVRVFTGLYYQNVYNGINAYLVDTVESPQVSINLAAAKEWLAKEKGKNQPLLSRPIVEALEQFISLERITEDNRCNKESYAILYKNNKAIDDRVRRKRNDIGRMRRIDSIIYQYNLKHALECATVYPQKYEDMEEKLDQDTLAKVTYFIDGYVDRVGLSKAKWLEPYDRTDDFNYAAQGVKVVYGEKAQHAAYETLKKFSTTVRERMYLVRVTNELNGKFEVNKERVGDLIDKYLVKPCLDYVTALGPDLFVPANYDWRILDVEDRYDGTSSAIRDFYRGWNRFRLCKRLVDKDRDALVKNVVKLANKVSYRG